MSRPRADRGFSLIELMIAVAIVAILASIATPLYTDAQLRARRSEVFVNLKGIAEAQEAPLADDQLVGRDDHVPEVERDNRGKMDQSFTPPAADGL